MVTWPAEELTVAVIVTVGEEPPGAVIVVPPGAVIVVPPGVLLEILLGELLVVPGAVLVVPVSRRSTVTDEIEDVVALPRTDVMVLVTPPATDVMVMVGSPRMDLVVTVAAMEVVVLGHIDLHGAGAITTQVGRTIVCVAGEELKVTVAAEDDITGLELTLAIEVSKSTAQILCHYAYVALALTAIMTETRQERVENFIVARDVRERRRIKGFRVFDSGRRNWMVMFSIA